MRLGIDFGTTHTVLAFVDRGNYPVVSFEGGVAVPSVVAVRNADGALSFGFEAAARAGDPGHTILRSLKRLLHDAGPLTEVAAGPRSLPLVDLIAGYLAHVRDELLSRSNAGAKARESLEAAVAVPANASSSQRFLTLDAFRRAGFDVVGVLNEPSAAGFEYAHRFASTLTSRREHLVVYDLGGGTFDASLIRMAPSAHEVLGTAGIVELGGDDFDDAILARVLEEVPGDAPLSGMEALRDECRRVKEAASSQTRRFVVDLAPLGLPPLALPMDEIQAACAPLVARTIEALERLAPATETGDAEGRVGWKDVAGIYVVGGASSFPLIPRQLRERFGDHRVRRSAHPFAATAIGLAIHMDETAPSLTDVLSRHFGVWREAEAGQDVSFDVIFPKGTRLPTRGEPPLEVVRRYRAAHSLGHFRYVESGQLTAGRPDGDIAPWDEVRFPILPGLREAIDLADAPIQRLAAAGPLVEERYACSAAGMLEVTLTLPEDGFTQTFRVARRTPVPQRRRKPPATHGS